LKKLLELFLLLCRPTYPKERVLINIAFSKGKVNI